MLPAIDCGNTNTVFSVWDGARFLATFRTSTEWQAHRGPVLRLALDPLGAQGARRDDRRRSSFSSTVPRVVFNLRVLCDRYFNTRPVVVGKADCALPVQPRVDPRNEHRPRPAGEHRRPRSTGTAATSWWSIFGTATTFDVVATDGAYVGGVIAPGVNLSLEALHQAAAALPMSDVHPAPGRDRHEHGCLHAIGVYWGYVGVVREIAGASRANTTNP